MGTFSVRGARPLALILVLALLLHDNAAAASTHRALQADAEVPELLWANATAAAMADELSSSSAANQTTDPVAAAIAKRIAAVGFSYEYARRWLSYRCPRREKDGTLTGITRRCYARGLRSLEEEALLRSRPPPQLSPEDEARRRVVELLSMCTMPVYSWPDAIRNPVIKTRKSPYGWPVPESIRNSVIETHSPYGVPVL
ncbi:hypothetical protein HU200_012197 [Digitaria exilis]|uniref:Uncharacterized protein n=1 Tax=Digitaria exilis TaxID=1010633 RepID=A0A835KM27_9POAL|nr:hypothetical protein HU200_012197 [Digitaria exilis]